MCACMPECTYGVLIVYSCLRSLQEGLKSLASRLTGLTELPDVGPTSGIWVHVNQTQVLWKKQVPLIMEESLELQLKFKTFSLK